MAGGKSPKTTSAPIRPSPSTSRKMSSSLSHSCGVHGWPYQVKLNGSVEGTRPVSAISLPAVMCQK